MILQISRDLLERIHAHGQTAYPEEAAGFLLGNDAEPRRVTEILSLPNSFEMSERQRRYLITPEAYVRAEDTAEQMGLALIGVFHSHPDHPNLPSQTDRDWAQPYFSYLITSVQAGQPSGSRCWRLAEDRSGFSEERIELLD